MRYSEKNNMNTETLKTTGNSNRNWISAIGMILVAAIFIIVPGTLTTVSACLVIALVVWQEKNNGFFASLGFKRSERSSRSIFFKAPIMAILLAAVYVLVLIPVVASITGEPSDLTAFEVFKGDLVTTLVSLPIIWLMAAFGEEIVFRGFLMTRFTRLFGESNWSLFFNLLLMGLVFGYAHGYQGLTGQILSGLTGMILAYIFHRNNNNIWFNIAVHGWFDTIAIIMFYFGAGDLI